MSQTPPTPQPPTPSKSPSPAILLLSAVVLSVLLSGALCKYLLIPKIAYVDTSKLMVGFSEANKVERDIKVEDDKWKENIKIMQDSLKSAVDTMSKYYDGSTIAKKRELQDNLSSWNQKINNYKQANMEAIGNLRQEKMQSVAEKINIYLSEYGKKKGYSIIFGTVAGGSILYGNEKSSDVTEEIINGLNERYK